MLQEDADGDGILGAKPGQENRLSFISTRYGLIADQTTRFVTDAGIDEDFGDKENGKDIDNRIVSIDTLSLSKAGDTLAYMSLHDGDGDGFITPVAGGKNIAILTTKSKNLINNETTINTLVTDAGPDEDFGDKGNEQEKDNRIISIDTLTIDRQGDTLTYLSIVDGDDDGFVTPVPNGENKAIITSKSKNEITGVTTVNIMISDAGPDEDFGDHGNEQEKDNRIYAFSVADINKNGDTLNVRTALDGDGDGIISAVKENKLNEAIYFHKIWDQEITIERVVINAGPDQNFETEDYNQVLSLKKVELDLNLDTLTFSEVMDADGDGIAFDTLADSSTVLVYELEIGSTTRNETWTTLVMFPGDDSKNYPIKLISNIVNTAGTSTFLKITGTSTDSTIDIEDTVFVSKENIYGPKHSKVKDLFIFKSGLGKDLYS
ncbi:MAG: hypothetical protein HRT90_11230, partial [Candidatus Margulisbacteria bacterium]|nr:hypothetical protein [Candidatus Margulisiibacteriota bacterium]